MGSSYTPVKPSGAAYPFPSFPDLGKEAREQFYKSYIINQFKINVKNKTCHGVEISTSAVHNQANQTAKADVTVKAMYPFLPGLSTTHKWDTDNVIKNEIALQDVVYPGLRLSSEFKYDVDKNQIGGNIKAQQKHQWFTADALFDAADEQKVLVGASLVTGYKGLIAAYKLDFDINSTELKTNNMGLGYYTKDYKFFTSFNNLSVFEGTFYHKVNREVEVAAMINVGGGPNNKTSQEQAEGEQAEGGGGGGGDGPQFGIAGRYVFSGYGHAIRAKVNNQSILGLGLELKVLPGWQFLASTEVDLKKFSEGGHKIGFGMDFGMDSL